MTVRIPDKVHCSQTKSPLFHFDQHVLQEGFHAVAGIDEAGRGPWAGPVVAAAVVMPKGVYIDRVDDSKKLGPDLRERLFERIVSVSCGYGIGIVSHEVIDEINILRATCLAMRRAVERLPVHVDLFMVDGRMVITGLPAPYRCYVRGDSRSFIIACASIIAKVTRDRIMTGMDARYPVWGFAGHKGYGTAGHRKAIADRGLSPIHRKSFRPMKEIVNRVNVS